MCTKRILTRGLLLATLATSAAQADTPDSAPPPDSTATPTVEPSSTPATVVPSSDADRKQAVADSRVTALVLSSPRDGSRPAFQLEPLIDVPVLAVDIIYRLGRLAKKQ